MKPVPVLLLAGLAYLLAACASAPPSPETHPSDVPGAFDETVGESRTPSELSWWDAFDDPVLTGLLHEVLAGNPGLDAAEARIRSARSMAVATGASAWPNVTASGSAQRAEQSTEGRNPLVGTEFPSLAVDVPGRTNNLYRAGFDAAWEIDLFGHTRHAVEAAKARAVIAELSRDDLVRTLLAETGRAYLDYRTAAARIALLDSNLELRTRTEALVNQRVKSGVATEFDLARAHGAKLELAARRPALETRLDAATRELAVLTAQQPSVIRKRLEAGSTLPSTDRMLGLDLPATLLARRPDLRAAEERIVVATGELGVAKAELYPRLSLVGSLGFESIDAATFADAASRYWSLGPHLTLPIFQGGALHARARARQAEVDAAYADFKTVFLRALREVEAEANRVQRTRTAIEVRQAARDAAETAHELAQKRYHAGVLPLDELLATEAEVNTADEQLLLARAEAAEAVISLGKSLGGGWTGTEGSEPDDR